MMYLKMISIVLWLLSGSQFAIGADTWRQDFENVPAGALPAGMQAASGEWAVGDGRMVGASDREALIRVTATHSEAFEFRAVVSFLEVREKSRWLGLCFGSSPAASSAYHQVTLRQDARGSSGVEYAVRMRDGSWRVRSRDISPVAFPLNERRAIRIRCAGGRVRVWVDDQMALDSVFAIDLLPGSLGLALSGSKVAFDEISLRKLEPEEIAAMTVRFGPMRPVRAIAHRGASRIAPENTLAAFRLAIEKRANGTEFDVYRTRDGKIAIIHDRDAFRTTNFRALFGGGRDAKIASMTWKELARLDAGSWKSAEYAKEPIPDLESALRLMKGHTLPVIEIKPKDIGGDVAREVRRLGMEGEVFVQSFSEEAIAEFRAVLPEVPTGLLTGKRVSRDSVERARSHLRSARLVGASTIVCNYQLASPEYVEWLHVRGLTVWVYTANDELTWEVLIRSGVDGIISDVPGELLAFLARVSARRGVRR